MAASPLTMTDAPRILDREGKRTLILGADPRVTLATLRGMAEAGMLFQIVQLGAHHDSVDHLVSHIVEEDLAALILRVGVRERALTRPAGVHSVRASELAATLLPGVPTYLTIDSAPLDLRELDVVLRQIAAVSTLLGVDCTEANPGRELRSILGLLCQPSAARRAS